MKLQQVNKGLAIVLKIYFTIREGGCNLSEKLKIERMQKKINQKELADKLGISARSYNLKENGKREFSVSEAKKLMELFGKKFEEIF